MFDTPPFPDWREHGPGLAVLERASEAIADELATIRHDPDWIPWVQEALTERPGDWQVFTIYGFDKIREAAITKLPRTVAALAEVPELRTALFSRLPARTRILEHEGPPALSNSILRCHLGLEVPGEAGVVCGGERRTIQAGRLLMFDDLHPHYGFNDAEGDRYVLICDVRRPQPWPLSHPEPTWGRHGVPDWPKGWQRVGAQGPFRHAPRFAAGLESTSPTSR